LILTALKCLATPVECLMMLEMVEGDRQPGQPARNWIDDILMWCGQGVRGAMTMTEDSDEWRISVAKP